MLCAIVAKGSGVIAIEEFRFSKSRAKALAAFCKIPVYKATNYLAVNTGWTEVQRPVQGNRWSFDHDANALVETKVV